MYKACIFDLDGTLLDTVESIAVNANKALEKYGLKTHPIDAYKYFAGDGQVKLIERALAASGDTELKMFEKVNVEYKRMFVEGCTYRVQPFDGICEMLDTLKTKGIKIAVLSNKNHENTVSAIEKAFGAGYFDFVLGKKDGIKLKPDPECVNILLGQLGVLNTECVYVGDTLTDMLTGKGSGMFTVGVTWGFRDRAELMSGNADAIIDRPDELLAFAIK
jgi:phosphoglycolate phosphatase